MRSFLPRDRVSDCRHRLKSDDDGFTVVELMLASALSAIVLGMVLLWLSSARDMGDQIVGDHDENQDLSFTLELALAELSDARPTELCLDPDPNTQISPETVTANCNTKGQNWGYWPTSTGTRSFMAGSPFHEATDIKLCFFALPEGTVPDPATSVAPWGSCLEQSGGQLLARTLEPTSAAHTDYLAAAIPSNYNWAAGTWTGRSLGKIDTIKFEYLDFTSKVITSPVAASKLDEIALVRIILTRGTGADEVKATGSLAIRANIFSPCRGSAAAPTCPVLDPPMLSVTGGSLKIDASWTLSGNVPATNYAVQYRKTSNTTWRDLSGPINTMSTTISSLTANISYDVRVRATNDADISDWSNIVQATPTT